MRRFLSYLSSPAIFLGLLFIAVAGWEAWWTIQMVRNCIPPLKGKIVADRRDVLVVAVTRPGFETFISYVRTPLLASSSQFRVGETIDYCLGPGRSFEDDSGHFIERRPWPGRVKSGLYLWETTVLYAAVGLMLVVAGLLHRRRSTRRLRRLAPAG